MNIVLDGTSSVGDSDGSESDKLSGDDGSVISLLAELDDSFCTALDVNVLSPTLFELEVDGCGSLLLLAFSAAGSALSWK